LGVLLRVRNDTATINGGAGDEPPGPGQSRDDGLAGGTGAVVLLADADSTKTS